MEFGGRREVDILEVNPSVLVCLIGFLMFGELSTSESLLGFGKEECVTYVVKEEEEEEEETVRI